MIAPGKWVKAVKCDPGYAIVSSRTGAVVGRRLDRGQGVYPECKTTRLTEAEAKAALAAWDKFCELNSKACKK